MSQTLNSLEKIRQRIAKSLQESNDPQRFITLLAVSKRHSLEKIIHLYQQGQRDFGESYVQEALEKIQQCPFKDIIWHFIGPIQSNKTKAIAEHFHWVHSVDRLKIARRLSAQRPEHLPPLKICLQVNISQEVQKSGFSQSDLYQNIEAIQALPGLQLRGLMAIPKAGQDYAAQRHSFRLLYQLQQQLNQQFKLNMDTLSMGMSSDLEAAIMEGSTLVRIGTALFGARAEH